MGLTNDEHVLQLGDSTVSVTGTSGPVHATWTLLVDGEPVDSARAAGYFNLRGRLPDGTSVAAAVHQSLMGTTRVVLTHDGVEVGEFRGFVA